MLAQRIGPSTGCPVQPGNKHVLCSRSLRACTAQSFVQLANGIGSRAVRLASGTRVSAIAAPPAFEAATTLTGLQQRVAYQGVPGAYSEIAAQKACPEWSHVPCDQFELVFQALSHWSADRAVLPIENSLGGSIHDVFDLLLRYRLHIVGEVSVNVNHCLLALPGVEKGNIKRVISHMQALAQCDSYLRQLTGSAREAVYDTAGAAETVATQQLTDVAAIASRRAGELYGLNILDEGIQDNKDNITRFIVLAREPLIISVPEAGKYKTSIAFSLREGPGQLWNALSVFALRSIDMTKVESRPMRTQPIITPTAPVQAAGEEELRAVRRYNYLFFVDIVGCVAEVPVQNALKNLEEVAPFVRVLGSYPMDKTL